MIQSVELNDKYFCAFNDSKYKKNFRLSNTARKIFWVARIFDATLLNFTNERAIAHPAPLSPTPKVVIALLLILNLDGFEMILIWFR